MLPAHASLFSTPLHSHKDCGGLPGVKGGQADKLTFVVMYYGSSVNKK